MTKKNQDFETIEDFSENTQSVRTYLIISAAIALFYNLTGAELDEHINILGLEFNNISEREILITLFIIVFYHFLQFTWLACEHIKNFKIFPKISVRWFLLELGFPIFMGIFAIISFLF